ncbi:MAG: hypothetical protein H0T18_08120 [Chloroflexia bacterium]|nr:hypothetical protein [Chloroflexia bacterium]
MTESRKSAGSGASQRGGSASGGGGSVSREGDRNKRSNQASTGDDGMAELKEQGQEAISQTKEAVSQAQDQAVKLVSMAREQATSQVTTQKERAAGMLGALGTALQDTGRQVREQDDTAMADYIDMAAEQVEQLASMLKEQDISQLIDTAQQFARRQPMMFVAAAIAVGFIGTRFMKSTSQPADGASSSDSSWSSGASSRSGMSSEFGDMRSTARESQSADYGGSMTSGVPGAGRQ